MGCNNGCGWGGNSCLWIIILIIIIFSCCGNSWSNWGGNNCGCNNCGC